MVTKLSFCFKNYMRPKLPAVNPTIKKKENSAKSLGKKLINSLN